VGQRARDNGAELKRGELWWADLGAYRPREQTGRRSVAIWQSDTLTRVLQSIVAPPDPPRALAEYASVHDIAGDVILWVNEADH